MSRRRIEVQSSAGRPHGRSRCQRDELAAVRRGQHDQLARIRVQYRERLSVVIPAADTSDNERIKP